MRILYLAGRRLAASIPTLVLILIGVFLLLQLAPGDTVDALMAQMGGGDAATARELRKFYGLDLSIPARLGNYLWHLVRSISAFPRSTASRWCVILSDCRRPSS
jgi:peptide/nickel transport system permease protein